MKKLLTILALIIIPFTPAIAEDMAMSDKKMMKPSVLAVAYHADWCGSCKVLGPKVMETKASLDGDLAEKVKFVKFDLTDNATKQASAKLAAENGITDHYADDAKTGKVKLIDPQNGNVLAVITKSFTVEQMKGILQAVSARS